MTLLEQLEEWHQNDEYQKIIEELEKTSAEAETDMIMIISRKQDLLPAEVQKYLV